MSCTSSAYGGSYTMAKALPCAAPRSNARALLTSPSTNPQVKGPSDRKNFKAKQFAAQHDLGDPIRVEWFLSSAEK